MGGSQTSPASVWRYSTFFEENCELSPATRAKLLSVLHDPLKRASLQIELAVVIDLGEHFVKATYTLEGDGPLAFTCFEVLSTVHAAISSLHLPNTHAVAQSLTCGASGTAAQWIQYAHNCIEPGIFYFWDKFVGELSICVAAFKRQLDSSYLIK